MMKIDLKIFYFFIVLSSHLSFAQRPVINNIDSVLKVLDKAKEDTSRVKLLGDIAYYYSTKDLEKAIGFAEQGLFLAKQIKDAKGEANSLLQIGMINNDLGKINSAINNFEMALAIKEKKEDRRFQAMVYNNMGMSYFNLSEFDKALEKYFLAIRLAEKFDDLRLTSSLYNNIANVYIRQKNSEKALSYHFKCLEIAEKLKNETLIAGSFNNIGIVYREMGKPEKALEYYFKTLEIARKINHKLGLSFTYNNIGTTYSMMKENEKALEYFFLALEIKKEIGEQKGIANTLNNIGSVYQETGRPDEAIKCFEQTISIGKEIGEKMILEHAYKDMATVYFAKNNFLKAFEFQKLLTGIKDSIYNEASRNKMAEMSAKFENEKKEKELKIQAGEIEKNAIVMNQNKIRTYLLMAGLLIVLISGLIVAVALRKYRIANKVLVRQNEKIVQQNKIIEKAHSILENKSKDITESILYARRIQEAILPGAEGIKKVFQQSFVLFKPRDFVSGDFYWFSDLKDYTVLAVADCTGHGVPGAFMSMIGNDLLNQVVNDGNLCNPAEALELMDKKIAKALSTSRVSPDTKDGIDMCLVAISKKEKILLFAGANRPLWIIKPAIEGNGNSVPVIREYKPLNKTLGIQDSGKEGFSTHSIPFEKGDMIYLFTDGFTDQFGGIKNKKFLTKRFRELLLSNAGVPMEEQHLALEKTFDSWKGKQKQVDDVCIIGIKV